MAFPGPVLIEDLPMCLFEYQEMATVTILRDMPNPYAYAMPGVVWGRPDVLFTPAYWLYQIRSRPDLDTAGVHRLGRSFHEEVVACLLGGHGIPAEVGISAFTVLRNSGIFSERSNVRQEDVFEILAAPLRIAPDRTIRYRFARQKSGYIASFLNTSKCIPQFDSHLSLRNWLTQFNGIGLKTASWAIRNWYDSDQVAILDVHIQRAGRLAGFFTEKQTISRCYAEMESQFVRFCSAIDARVSSLDAIIWSQMRRAGDLAIRCMPY